MVICSAVAPPVLARPAEGGEGIVEAAAGGEAAGGGECASPVLDGFARGGATGTGGAGSGGGDEALERARNGSSTGGNGACVIAIRRAWAA